MYSFLRIASWKPKLRKKLNFPNRNNSQIQENKDGITDKSENGTTEYKVTGPEIKISNIGELRILV